MVDPKLKEWATPRQIEVIDAINSEGGIRQAAKLLLVAHQTVQSSLASVKRKAAKSGYSPEHDMTKQAPDGFSVKGVSTYYDEDGQIKAQWVKTNQNAEKAQEAMQIAVEAMCEKIKTEKPAVISKKSAQQTENDLLNCYVVTDYHLGQLSWGEESGDDWDIQIAEDLLVDWFKRAIQLAPNAEVGIFAQLGDYLNSDGLDAVTPTGNNILDSDSRFQKMVRVAIRASRRIVSLLLKKHKHVHIIMAEGNHDLASSVWLREFMAALYLNESRVTVDQSADIYYAYEHGLTSLFFHHGHKKKPNNIDDVFAAKFREMFGRTKFSYAHMGHMHHIFAQETNLMVVEQHRTLAAKSSYASRGGWEAGREAKVICYSKQFGEVSRLTISPDMVKSI